MDWGNREARVSAVLVALGCVTLIACGDSSGDTRASDSGGTSDGTSGGEATAGTTAGGATESNTSASQSGTETGASMSGTETSAATTGGETTSTATTTEGDTTGVEEPCPEDCEEMGGVCVGSICCAPDLACGDVCCEGGEVCSFQQCVTPGSVCIDNTDCAMDEYCEFSLGEPAMEGMGECAGGFEPATGKCLPEPPVCAPGEEPMEGEEIDCLTECEYVPDGSFTPVVKHHWALGTVMMAPIVAGRRNLLRSKATPRAQARVPAMFQTTRRRRIDG
ncbi:MAG: hypothetical protein KC468_32685 [Myxococcales bacterium]|nr:hypothetical protein [Myxococcales bacterium]